MAIELAIWRAMEPPIQPDTRAAEQSKTKIEGLRWGSLASGCVFGVRIKGRSVGNADDRYLK
jgi:hypothetical protein